MTAPSLRTRIAIISALGLMAWAGLVLACFWLVHFSGQAIAMLLKAVS